MLATSLILLLPFLSTSIATRAPPHLRHRRLAAENIRHIKEDQPAYLARALPARANEAHADAHRIIKRSVMKRGQQCRLKNSTSSSITPAVQAVTSTSIYVQPTSTSTSDPVSSSSVDQQQAWAQASTTTTSWTAESTTSSWSDPTPSASDISIAGISVSGLLAITDNKCGYCDSSDSQPNGSEEWLNCGIDGNGWTPPYVTMNQLIATDLNANGVFAPCAPYIDKFNAYGAQYGVHPIMLASFAMQESTCNPGATGGNGEAGLMQISPSNCEAGNSCWDVDYNIRRGAELFSNMIASSGGNVLQAIGAYNGWQPDMTVWSATKAKSEGRCAAQNNLDYLYQFTNGWMQNKEAHGMGSYFNLNGC